MVILLARQNSRVWSNQPGFSLIREKSVMEEVYGRNVEMDDKMN
jgi:hypothetical protein